MKVTPKLSLLVLIVFSANCLFAQIKTYRKGCIIDSNFFTKVHSLNNYKTISINDDGITYPKQKSLYQFAPRIADQGNFGTCVGWSTAYYAGSILYNLAMNDTADKSAFSAMYLYNSLKESDGDCDQGQRINKALNFMKYRGMLPKKDYQDYCALETNNDSSYLLDKAFSYRIKDYITLPKEQIILRIKKSIFRNHPVVIGIYTPMTLESNLNGEVWDGVFDENRGGHALCLVGYDDEKEGGAFEIINSWGSKWGHNGRFWVRYEDFNKLIKEAYEVIGYNESELKSLKSRYNYNVSLMAINEEGKKLSLNHEEVYESSYNYAFGEFGSDVLKPYFIKYELNDSSKTGAYNFKLKLSCKDSSYVYIFNHNESRMFQVLSNNGNIPFLSKSKPDLLMPQSDYLKVPEIEPYAYSNYQELTILILYSKKLLDQEYLDEILNDKYYSPENFVLKNFKHQMNCKPIRNIDENYIPQGYFSSSDYYGLKNSPGTILPVIVNCQFKKFHEKETDKKSKKHKKHKKKRFKWLKKKKKYSEWDFEL